ncbi:hypothetical protein CYMTET_26328 [Cymbomonas tetramitiformis]|uniref:Uncharacterized protein n=1 Tax=Cymbomonas tetramitiformis TaxID=36881 RepID=A0AAE0FS33_9CHLO|nr:hypothetical protein CYMTET_26328 [Cymbomonas tetramitiformis]
MSLKRTVRAGENLCGKVLKTPLSFFDVPEQPGKFFRGVVKKRCSHKVGHWAVRYTDGTEYNLPEPSIKQWICSPEEVKDNKWAYQLSDVDSSASASEEVEDPSSDNTPVETSESESEALRITSNGAGPSVPPSRAVLGTTSRRQTVARSATPADTKLQWDAGKTKEADAIPFTATSGFQEDPPPDAPISYFFELLWWLSKPGQYAGSGAPMTRTVVADKWRSL